MIGLPLCRRIAKLGKKIVGFFKRDDSVMGQRPLKPPDLLVYGSSCFKHRAPFSGEVLPFHYDRYELEVIPKSLP